MIPNNILNFGRPYAEHSLCVSVCVLEDCTLGNVECTGDINNSKKWKEAPYWNTQMLMRVTPLKTDIHLDCS
jgi:hypothetical protein